MTGHIALAAIGYAALLDACIETFVHGSPVRWWVAGIAVVYATVTTLCWRRTTWRVRTVSSFLVLTGILALTACLPGGLSDGIRIAMLPTSTVLSLAAVAAVAVAAAAIWRWREAPRAVRIPLVVASLYCGSSFLAAIAHGHPFASLFASGSFWRALPFLLQGAALAAFFVLPIGIVALVARTGLRLPARGDRRRTGYQAVAIASVLMTCVSAMWPLPSRSLHRAPEATAASRPESISIRLSSEKDLENGLRALADGRMGLRRERWDPEYVVQRLGPDATRLFEWVRANTFWVPYRGVLRGPVGVLMDRLGNSLDRSLLLAALLSRSGHPVRLAHAQLSREEAVARIVRAAVAAPLPTRAPDDATGIESDIRAVAADYQLAPDGIGRTIGATAQGLLATFAELDRRVPDQTQRLLAAIPRPVPAVEFAQRFDAAVTAAQEHWWVQARRDDERWVDFDLVDRAPAAASRQPVEVVDPAQLPTALYHAVTVRVLATQQSTGFSATNTILEHTVRPMDVVGRPMTLQLFPLRWPMDSPAADTNAFRALLAAQEQWSATLYVGTDVVAQGGMNARGERQSSGGGGLGTAIGSIFGQASGRSNTELTAAWIEYEIRIPDSSAGKVRRALFDFSDSGGSPLADAAKLTRGVALMTRTEILPLGWELAPDFVVDSAVKGLIDNRERLLAAASVAAGRTSEKDDALLTAKGTPAASPLLMFALARFEWSRVGHRVFHDRPNVVTRHVQIAPNEASFAMRTTVDIVANEVGVDLLATYGFATRLEQGVMDTNVESLLQFGTAAPGNTADAFVTGRDWLTLTARDDPASKAGLVGRAARLAAGDLEAGRIIVTPKRDGDNADGEIGWWRIDPQTGDTLGIGPDGHGQATRLLVALQSSGETSVHYNVLTEAAKGFVYQEAFCRALPIPFVAVRQSWRLFLRELAGPGLRDSIDRMIQPKASLREEIASSVPSGTKLCIFATMAAGVLVTLPLVIMTARFALMGRIATFAAEEGAAAGRAAGSGRPPWWRFGRGPARPAPAPTEPTRPPIEIPPGTPIKRPGPEPCSDAPPGFGDGLGRERTDDGFGNYPPNSPTYGPPPTDGPPPLPPHLFEPWVESAAEEAAHLERMRADVPERQGEFDEALARYREMAQKVESYKGRELTGQERLEQFNATQYEKAAGEALNRARWELMKAKQRVLYFEERAPAAQELREAQAQMEAALRARQTRGESAWDQYFEAVKRLEAAKQKFLSASDKKLSSYPVSVGPSAPPGGGAPPPVPELPGRECGGTQAPGSTQQDLGNTQPDPHNTQPDLGSTLPGGRPSPIYAPVRGGPQDPKAPIRTMVGIGGILGGGS